ncbi:MAG: hypothetical protein PHH77_09570 [Victivallaceae bacterium]|nr:hypothetical protein [Victivallaceae bacterium]
MFADNPQGVGLGRSGVLFTWLYCPAGSDIACRTMVNSFLTFAVEQGLWLSAALLALGFAALLAGWDAFRDETAAPAGRVGILSLLTAAFAGILSGMMSNCFDFSIARELLNPPDTALNSYLQFVLTALWCVLPVGLLIAAGRGNYRRLGKRLTAGILLSVLLLSALYFTGKCLDHPVTGQILHQAGVTVVSIEERASLPKLLFIPDDRVLPLRAALDWLRRTCPGYNYLIPLTGVSRAAFALTADTVVLCGRNCFWSEKLAGRRIYLLLPAAVLPRLPAAVRIVFLPEFDNDGYNRRWKELLATGKSGSGRSCEIRFY